VRHWKVATIAAGCVFAWTFLASWALIALYYMKFEFFVPVFDIPDHLSWPWVAWWRQLISGDNDASMWQLIEASAALGALAIALVYFMWRRTAWARRFRRRSVRPW
jgi:membrane associated rhomboid family serine protease